MLSLEASMLRLFIAEKIHHIIDDSALVLPVRQNIIDLRGPVQIDVIINTRFTFLIIMTFWQGERIMIKAIVWITKALNQHNVRFLKLLQISVGSSVSLTIHIGHCEVSGLTTFAILI